MFPDRIRQTAFTDPDVEGSFKITGEDVYDTVLKSVLRAILPSRMGDESLYIRYREKDYSKSTIEDNSEQTAMGAVYGDAPDYSNTLTVINMSRMPELSSLLIDNFCKRYEGWKRVERMTKFFESSFQLVCFVNEEVKSCILLVGRLDITRLHYITCSLAAFLPWYFPKEKGLTAEERALLMSLRKNRCNDFMEALAAFESQFDFYTMKLEALTGFESEWMKGALDDSRRRIKSLMENIDEHQRRIDSCLRDVEEERTREIGLATRINDENENELRDFFIENKSRVRMTARSGSNLTFEVLTTVMYWDEDMAETLLDNKHSYIYTARGSRPRMKSDDFAKLFKAIFVDQSMKLRFCAQYKISISDRTVYGVDHAEYSSAALNFMPNTHIDSYSCLGDYREVLNRMMQNHDYVGIMEQCVVSAQSFNFHDTTVLEKWSQLMYETDKKCILLPDGTEATPVEAVQYLNGGESAEEEEHDGEES